jgi:ribonuclease VapC
MVIDSSALIAILLDEPERADFNRKIEKAIIRMISAGSLLETAMVIESRLGQPGRQDLDLFIEKASIRVIPFDSDQVELAREAFRQYGKGQHPAGLNFGDCFAYALAKVTNEPLLFKGDDFSRTDITTC